MRYYSGNKVIDRIFPIKLILVDDKRAKGKVGKRHS
jgi:hypothetical protein